MKKKHSAAYRIWLLILIVLFGLGLWLAVDGAIRYARSRYTTRDLPKTAGAPLSVPYV